MSSANEDDASSASASSVGSKRSARPLGPVSSEKRRRTQQEVKDELDDVFSAVSSVSDASDEENKAEFEKMFGAAMKQHRQQQLDPSPYPDDQSDDKKPEEEEDEDDDLPSDPMPDPDHDPDPDPDDDPDDDPDPDPDPDDDPGDEDEPEEPEEPIVMTSMEEDPWPDPDKTVDSWCFLCRFKEPEEGSPFYKRLVNLTHEVGKRKDFDLCGMMQRAYDLDFKEDMRKTWTLRSILAHLYRHGQTPNVNMYLASKRTIDGMMADLVANGLRSFDKLRKKYSVEGKGAKIYLMLLDKRLRIDERIKHM